MYAISFKYEEHPFVLCKAVRIAQTTLSFLYIVRDTDAYRLASDTYHRLFVLQQYRRGSREREHCEDRSESQCAAHDQKTSMHAITMSASSQYIALMKYSLIGLWSHNTVPSEVDATNPTHIQKASSIAPIQSYTPHAIPK